MICRILYYSITTLIANNQFQLRGRVGRAGAGRRLGPADPVPGARDQAALRPPGRQRPRPRERQMRAVAPERRNQGSMIIY